MTIFRNSMIVGSIASFVTATAAALFGRKEGTPPAAPVNAISHIAWGEEAAHVDKPDFKHTVVGMVLNTGAQAFWAFAHEAILKKVGRRDLPTAIASGAVVATAAYVVDYHVVPKRLTPGFEKRLSEKSLLGVYAVMAITLALGSMSRKS